MLFLDASIASTSNRLQYLTDLTEQIFFPLCPNRISHIATRRVLPLVLSLCTSRKNWALPSLGVIFSSRNWRTEIRSTPLTPTQPIPVCHYVSCPGWSCPTLDTVVLPRLRTTQRGTTTSSKLLATHHSCQDSSVPSLQ